MVPVVSLVCVLLFAVQCQGLTGAVQCQLCFFPGWVFVSYSVEGLYCFLLCSVGVHVV